MRFQAHEVEGVWIDQHYPRLAARSQNHSNRRLGLPWQHLPDPDVGKLKQQDDGDLLPSFGREAGSGATPLAGGQRDPAGRCRLSQFTVDLADLPGPQDPGNVLWRPQL